MTWFWVFIGGGIGSVMRFGTSKVKFFKSIDFPLATLFSNVLASLCLGLIVWVGIKYGKQEWYWPFFAIGVCGGFSTFSTFSMENIQLLQQGNYLYALLNVFVSILLSGVVFLLVTKLPQ